MSKSLEQLKWGVHDSLGSLEWGAGFPREFRMGVQDSLGNLEWGAGFPREFRMGCRIPYDSRDSIFPKGMSNFLGNFYSGMLNSL